MAETSIEWTDAPWNPVAGCAVLSPGCTNCYAMRDGSQTRCDVHEKVSRADQEERPSMGLTGKVRVDRKSLDIPKRWKKPRKIFVNSMSDLFHEAVSAKFVGEVWSVMEETPQHTFQILTKRPDRMLEVTRSLPVPENVWLGTSTESSEYLDRIDILRKASAAIKFVSFEPLLGLRTPTSAALIGRLWVVRADRVPAR
jgi:protein gp37